MKERRKTLVIIAVIIGSLCLTTGAVYLNNGLSAGIEEELYPQQMERELDPETENMLQDADMSRLENASVRTDESVQSYITALFQAGESQTEADMQALLDVVKFWEDTNDDIQIVGEIYQRRPMAESLSKWSFNRPWIESSYNVLTGRNDILSTDDVKDYLEAGLSYEDIIAASRLSLKDEVTTNQALDCITEGETWYSVLTGDHAATFSEETVSPSMLLDARNLAEAKQVSINTVLERMEAGETLTALKTAEFDNAAEPTFKAEFENHIDNIEDTEITETEEPTENIEATETAPSDDAVSIANSAMTAATSTSSSIVEVMAEIRGQEKYLESAHAPSDNTEDNDHVDTSTGNVVLSETDLYLPGKNGMDLTLKRNFNSFDTDEEYYFVGQGMPDEPVKCNMFFYKYQRDDDTDIWVAFASEEEFLDAPEVFKYYAYSTHVYDFDSKNNGKISGLIYTHRVANSTTFHTLTLKKPIVRDEGFVSSSENMDTQWPRAFVGKKRIDYNWYYNVPYTEVTPISSAHSSDPKKNEYYNKNYLKLYDGENQIDLTYYFYYKKVDENWQIDFDFTAIHKSYDNPNHYVLREMTAEEAIMLEEKVGNKVNLKLCCILERDDGMRYFLNYPHTDSKIVLVADRFGNCIDYSIDGEIIDSMGRRIVYSPSGIQIEDENGNLQYVVKYSVEETTDPNNEYFYRNNTYTFRAERFAQLGDTVTDDVTVYSMKKHGRPAPGLIWCTFYYTIDKIEYPTGAHRDYTYEEIITWDPFTNSDSQKFTFRRCKAVSSKLYADNGTDYEYSYEYIYTKPDEGKYLKNSTKVDKRFTTEKNKIAPNASDNIKTIYTYDYLNRILTAESFKGTTRIYPQYTYTYPANSESARENPTDVETKLETSVTKTDSYSYYYNNKIPNLISSNGLETSYSFDYMPYANSNRGYFQIRSIGYKEPDATGCKKIVSNTLTADRKNVAVSVVKDAGGTIKEKTEFEYNTDGTVSKTKVYSDIANNVYTETNYTYTYNTDASYSVTTMVINVKDANGANAHTVSTTTVYDRFGNVASQTDAKGIKTEYTYDLSGRVLSVKVKNAAGNQLSEKTYSYDVDGNIVDITRENGRQEKQIFDSFGNPQKSQVNYDGGFKTVYEYTYDTFGRPVSTTEIARYAADGTVEEKYTTTNEYDDRSRVTKQTTKNKAGTVVYEVSAEYSSASGKQYTTRWLSGSAKYSAAKYRSEYDAFGRKTADVILNNTTEYSRTDYTHDCFGNILTAKDDKARASGLPYSVQYVYDQSGRVLSETDVFGNTAENTYDNMGNLIITEDAAGKTVSYSYDALGRNTIVYDGSMYSKNYYDNNGNLIKTTESQSANATSGHVTTLTYDDLNRMTKMVNSTSKTDLSSTTGIYEHYTYDIMGNVLSTAQDSLGTKRTTYTYDVLGRNLSVTDPAGNAETYTYNFDGTLKTKTDKKGTVFTYSNYNVFKNAGKITAVNGSQSQYLQFNYDMMNNLTYEYDSEGLDYSGISYDYDFLGRLTAKNGDINAYLSYTYDTLGNRASMAIGENDQQGGTIDYCTQTYAYDAKSRMTATSAFDKTAQYEYNGSDYLTFKQFGVVQTTRNRNNRNLVTSDTILKDYGFTNEYVFESKYYRYDYRGEQTEEGYGYTDGFSDMRFELYHTYDGAGRLTKTELTDTSAMRGIDEFFTLDERTNITNILVRDYDRDDKSYSASYPYTLSNHMSGTVLANKTGYLEEEKTAASDANGNRTADRDAVHTYDLFNRLTSFTKDGVTTTYTYYASGLRESKTTNGVTTKFIWDGGNLVLEYRPDIWEYTHTYIYGADGLAYRRDDDGTIYTYNTSYRGDVLSIMDENQNRMAEYVFDAYGNIFEQYNASGFSDNFGYRGEYRDPESGYIYLRMRYFDPTSGRFLTEDPAKDGLNWFSYCDGNPVRYTDPSGLAIICDEANSERIIALLKEVSGNSLEFEYKNGQINITKTFETKHHVGQTLVSDLINSSETVNINIGVDNEGNTNTEWTANRNNPMQIYIDPDNATGYGLFTTFTQDVEGNILEELIPAYIVFGHELVHSWRDIKGLDIPSRDMVGLIPQDSPQLWREEELQTMGINYTDASGNPMRNYSSYNGIISENGLRLENGLNVRISYYGW